MSEENLPTVQSALLKIVERPDIDPDRLEKFLDLQIKMEERQASQQFGEALAGFQGDCPIIPKSKKVSFTASSGKKTEYDYAPIDEIVHIIKPLMQKWGLSYSFNIISHDEKKHEILTKIRHKSGYEDVTSFFFDPLHNDTRMNTSQRAKAAVTFAKRSALENALGIVTAGQDEDAYRLIDSPATEDDVSEIKRLIKTTKSDEKQVLQYLGIDDFSEMDAALVKKAKHALKQKRSK